MKLLTLICAALASWLCLPAPAVALLYYDEAFEGDLPSVAPSPVVLPLALGANIVLGSMHADDSSSDFDSFGFTVPAFGQLGPVLLSFDTELQPGETQAGAAFSLYQGNAVSGTPLETIVVDLTSGEPGFLFTYLYEGTYLFYNHSLTSTPGLGWEAVYSFELFVLDASGPEASALLLLGAGPAALALRRRGRSTVFSDDHVPVDGGVQRGLAFQRSWRSCAAR